MFGFRSEIAGSLPRQGVHGNRFMQTPLAEWPPRPDIPPV
jgi:hypothetical protein